MLRYLKERIYRKVYIGRTSQKRIGFSILHNFIDYKTIFSIVLFSLLFGVIFKNDSEKMEMDNFVMDYLD